LSGSDENLANAPAAASKSKNILLASPLTKPGAKPAEKPKQLQTKPFSAPLKSAATSLKPAENPSAHPPQKTSGTLPPLVRPPQINAPTKDTNTDISTSEAASATPAKQSKPSAIPVANAQVEKPKQAKSVQTPQIKPQVHSARTVKPQSPRTACPTPQAPKQPSPPQARSAQPAERKEPVLQVAEPEQPQISRQNIKYQPKLERQHLPAGMPRPRASLNKKSKTASIGCLIHSMQAEPSKTPFYTAAIASVLWLFIGGLLGWLLVGQSFNDFSGYKAVLGSSSIYILAASVLVPIAIFWFIAQLIVRSQEMKLMASAMTEVAIRLAEPDKMAEQKVASVGQTIRRQVSAMDDAISRAIGRAGELEALVHNEVAALERSYSQNEYIIRNLLNELVSEREAIAHNSQQVKQTLQGVGARVTSDIRIATDDIGQTLSQHGTMSALKLQQAGDHVTQALRTTTEQTVAIKQKISAELPQLLDKMNVEQERLGRVIDGANHNLGQLDTTLVQRTVDLDQQLAQRTADLDSKLAQRTKDLDNKLAKHTSDMDQQLADRTTDLDKKLIRHTTQLDHKIARRTLDFDSRLTRRTTDFDSRLAKQTSAFDDHLSQRTTEIDGMISKHTGELNKRLVQKVKALDASLAMRTKAMDKALASKAREIDRTFVAHRDDVDTTMQKKAIEIDKAISSQAKAMDASLTKKARTIDAALTRRLNSLEEQAAIQNARQLEETAPQTPDKEITNTRAPDKTETQSRPEAKTEEKNTSATAKTNPDLSMLRGSEALERAMSKQSETLHQNLDSNSSDLNQTINKQNEFSPDITALTKKHAQLLNEQVKQAALMGNQLLSKGNELKATAGLLNNPDMKMSVMMGPQQNKARAVLADIESRSEDLQNNRRAYTNALVNSLALCNETGAKLKQLLVENASPRAEQAIVELEQANKKNLENTQESKKWMEDYTNSLSQHVVQLVTGMSRSSSRTKVLPGEVANTSTDIKKSVKEQLRALDALAQISGATISNNMISATDSRSSSQGRGSHGQGHIQPQGLAGNILQPPTKGVVPTATGMTTKGANSSGAGTKRPSQWSFGDLLARVADTDTEHEEQPLPTYRPSKAGGSTREADKRKPSVTLDPLDVLRMDDIARALDSHTAALAWKRSQSGERNVFTRRLYTPEGQATFDQISERYHNNEDFHATVEKYVRDFEGLMNEAKEKDPSGRVIQNYLTSETGRAYLVLAHISGRLG
jgi:hypothetical protein